MSTSLTPGFFSSDHTHSLVLSINTAAQILAHYISTLQRGKKEQLPGGQAHALMTSIKSSLRKKHDQTKIGIRIHQMLWNNYFKKDRTPIKWFGHVICSALGQSQDSLRQIKEQLVRKTSLFRLITTQNKVTFSPRRPSSHMCSSSCVYVRLRQWESKTASSPVCVTVISCVYTGGYDGGS